VSGATPFKFRLERVRDLRQRREDLAKQELAGAMARHRAAEDALRDAEEQVEQARAAQLQSAAAPRSAAELIHMQAYLERAESATSARRQHVHQHEVEVARHRELLTSAARDRQALERLKERRAAEHRLEAERLAGIGLDEIALNTFRRNAA
jgi:flagellar FliJ protein